MSGCTPPVWTYSDEELLDDDHLSSLDIDDDFKWEVTTEPGESPLCSICRLVLKTLRTNKDAVTTTIPAEVRSRAGCHLCALFGRYYARRKASQGPEPELFIRYEYEEVDLRQATLWLMTYEVEKPFSLSNWYGQSALGCVPAIDATRSVQDLSSLKSFERSMDLAKRWLQRCQTSHSICQSATKFIPTRVIDVGDKHFFHYFMKPVLRNGKDLPSGSRYLTLSHCWGMVVPIKLTTSNLSSMMESIPFHQLPKTFQDAIIVAQNLGVRYLWIDSLCIIQDSNKDWQHESALMAEVYRNGTCNLSAAQASDSSEGLFLKHNPGFTKLIKARFATNEKGFVMHGFWPENIWNNGLRGSPLMRRGWVLQERLISRCNIHFTRDQLLWECRDRTACETFPDQFPFKEDPRPQKLLFSRSLYGVVKASNSITDTWNFTVAEYTSCSLTYSTDKLPAFGGLAAAFSTFSGRTYLAGLWLENIAYQLCWSGRSATTASPYVAPSWSWASTEGAVRDTFLPVHTCIRQLDILEAHVDLVSENPYGQVSGGYLRVTGRLATAKIVHQERPTLLLPNVTGVYMDLLVTLSLSWNEARISDALQSSSPKFGVMYVLAVMERVDEKAAYMEAMKGKWEKDGRREARTRWLILCRVKNHTATFRRCGTFAVDGSYFDRFEQACKQFDNDPRDVPLHSYEEGYGAKYAITII